MKRRGVCSGTCSQRHVVLTALARAWHRYRSVVSTAEQDSEGALRLSESSCNRKTGYTYQAEHSGEYRRQYIFDPKDASPPEKVPVVFSYDVIWTSSNIQWASRWDIYLSMGDRYSDNIHWFAIVNSLIIVLFLTVGRRCSRCPPVSCSWHATSLTSRAAHCCSVARRGVCAVQGMVALIMVRALYKDFSRYNRVATDEEKAEDREETGWKLVHGDVFRPPTRMPQVFAAVVGAGTQVGADVLCEVVACGPVMSSYLLSVPLLSSVLSCPVPSCAVLCSNCPL